MDYTSSTVLFRSWSCIVRGQGTYDLGEVCWLVKSGLRFTIMVVMVQSIPTDSTVDWRMLVSRSVLD